MAGIRDRIPGRVRGRHENRNPRQRDVSSHSSIGGFFFRARKSRWCSGPSRITAFPHFGHRACLRRVPD
jgi:hypothetical protein